jgi:hypothetical protein
MLVTEGVCSFGMAVSAGFTDLLLNWFLLYVDNVRGRG